MEKEEYRSEKVPLNEEAENIHIECNAWTWIITSLSNVQSGNALQLRYLSMLEGVNLSTT